MSTPMSRTAVTSSIVMAQMVPEFDPDPAASVDSLPQPIAVGGERSRSEPGNGREIAAGQGPEGHRRRAAA